MTELYDTERLVRKLLDHERRITRLEEEMDTARALLAESLKLHLNEERRQA